VSCPRSSLYNSSVILFENLPFPSLAKRGENRTEKIPPLKKGDKGGFEFNFSGCYRLDFLNELLTRHTRMARQRCVYMLPLGNARWTGG
jgi:hypothetical protein